jgi:hypothetical protein
MSNTKKFKNRKRNNLKHSTSIYRYEIGVNNIIILIIKGQILKSTCGHLMNTVGTSIHISSNNLLGHITPNY